MLCITLHFRTGDHETKVVEKQKLELELIKFCQREATNLWVNQKDERDRCRLVRTNLGVARVCVEDVAEKLACDGNASDDESMDIVRVYDESAVGSVGGEF